MGSWYRVVKTIKGHQYIYEQQTFREGKHVRTRNRYIGPAGGDQVALTSGGQPAGQLAVTTTSAHSWGWFGSIGKAILKQFDAKSWVIDTAAQLGFVTKKKKKVKKHVARKHAVRKPILFASYKHSISYEYSKSVTLYVNNEMISSTQTIVVKEYRYQELTPAPVTTTR